MGNITLRFGSKVGILSSASVVGSHEHEGPIGDVFDLHDSTDRFGKKNLGKGRKRDAKARFQRCALKSKAFARRYRSARRR